MFCVVEVFEEISRKCRELSEDMSRCEWSVYVDVLDESYPAMQEELARMRELFWNSSRIGTQVMLYSDPYPREYKYHRVNGELHTKPEYTELYDPVQECWKKLKSRISRETLIPIFRELSIDEIFKPHLIYASMAYQWVNRLCWIMSASRLKRLKRHRVYLINVLGWFGLKFIQINKINYLG